MKQSGKSWDLTAQANNKDKDRDMNRQVSPTVRIKGGGGTQSIRLSGKNSSPLPPGNDVSAARGPPTVFDAPPFQDLRVLVVDESKKFVKHSTKHLQSLGCVVTEAKGCKQALRLLTTVRFGVMLLLFMT